jgi:hypothetical protein
MLSLGVAGIYAQQNPVRMTFSGSKVATSINLGPNTRTDEVHLAGNGALGPFTFRGLRTDETSYTLGSCGSGFGPNFRLVAGAGVFRIQDGSLLTVNLTKGALCVDVSVDRFGRSHDVPNLFIGDASVFPAYPEKNPTLTNIALSWRMSDHLVELARRGDLGA